MKSRLAIFLGLVLVCLLAGGAAFAHHGNVAYNMKDIVVLKNATVTKFFWANPHCILAFDIKDDSGNVTHWAAEAGSPSSLALLGWSRTVIEPGDVITVNLFQSKTGNPVGRLQKIVLADGKTYKDSALGYLDPDSKDSKKSE